MRLWLVLHRLNQVRRWLLACWWSDHCWHSCYDDIDNQDRSLYRMPTHRPCTGQHCCFCGAEFAMRTLHGRHYLRETKLVPFEWKRVG